MDHANAHIVHEAHGHVSLLHITPMSHLMSMHHIAPDVDVHARTVADSDDYWVTHVSHPANVRRYHLKFFFFFQNYNGSSVIILKTQN